MALGVVGVDAVPLGEALLDVPGVDEASPEGVSLALGDVEAVGSEELDPGVGVADDPLTSGEGEADAVDDGAADVVDEGVDADGLADAVDEGELDGAVEFVGVGDGVSSSRTRMMIGGGGVGGSDGAMDGVRVAVGVALGLVDDVGVEPGVEPGVDPDCDGELDAELEGLVEPAGVEDPDGDGELDAGVTEPLGLGEELPEGVGKEVDVPGVDSDGVGDGTEAGMPQLVTSTGSPAVGVGVAEATVGVGDGLAPLRAQMTMCEIDLSLPRPPGSNTPLRLMSAHTMSPGCGDPKIVFAW